MNAYLFTAGLTRTQVCPTPGRGGQMVDSIRTWDACASAVICGGEAEQAQKRFDAWCRQTPEGQNPLETEIKKVVAAQFVDQLFTESGGKPLDWPQISQQVNDILQATPVDDFEQGYWVDVNQAVPPGKISFDVGSLKRDLQEDIRSGLNWSPDKKFFFLVSVLSPLPSPAVYPDELESDRPDCRDTEDEDGDREEKPDLDGFVATLPEMRDKEAAALVEACNSVVAAWLWRKYAAGTRLAANEIQITPCCSIVPVE
ncbi:MAG: hypothetical protein ABSA45_05820 [Verrucomicrobiota bacterium]|jgi:hypothetical protein